MSRPGMRPLWQPERETDWREAERRAAEAMREAHRRSAPQPPLPEAAQAAAPPGEPASFSRPLFPPPRFRRPWQDYEEGDNSVWRAQDDDEPDFFPPAPPSAPPEESAPSKPPEPPCAAPQREQRSPADRETLLVAALLYILWTQEADRELLAAMAYILL